jgi:hypothetical protein
METNNGLKHFKYSPLYFNTLRNLNIENDSIIYSPLSILLYSQHLSSKNSVCKTEDDDWVIVDNILLKRIMDDEKNDNTE